VVGTLHPAVGFVFAKGVGAFSELDPHNRRLEGDRHALYFFIIALVSFTAAIQYFCLNSASALLTSKLRTLSFSAILRQESMLCVPASEYDHSNRSLS
jgi:ATP-binding cassette subfamily B (MDR/TAP) protein 1